MTGLIYVATETFVDGEHNQFRKDITMVREGHPILAKYPGLFRVAVPKFEWPEVEQATSAPGEQRRSPGRPRKESLV